MTPAPQTGVAATTPAVPSRSPLLRGDTSEAATLAARLAAQASAAAPQLRKVGRAPGAGWLYGRVDAARQYACAASPQKSSSVSVVVSLGLHATGKKAELHVVVERSEDAESGCSFSGKPSSLLRVSYDGDATVRGLRRVYRFTSWRSGELLGGADTFSSLARGGSSLTLDCGSATVEAHAYEADDDRENTAGFLSAMRPNVPVVECRVSEPPLAHALFEQWLYQERLLFAPEPGVELRAVLYDGMDSVALRVGSTAPAYAISRKRVGTW